MNRPWFVARPELLDAMRHELAEHHPDLHLSIIRGTAQIRGSFVVSDAGRALARFAIEIDIPHDYPRGVPVVREVGGHVPRTADFHVNAGGSACLFLPEERWRVWPEGSSMLTFLDGPMRHFFIGQALKALGEDWPFGERTHGIEGALEYCKDVLQSDDEAFVNACLAMLSQPGFKGFRGHWPCPCESGLRIRECHPGLLADMHEKIPAARAATFVRQSQGRELSVAGDTREETGGTD